MCLIHVSFVPHGSSIPANLVVVSKSHFIRCICTHGNPRICLTLVQGPIAGVESFVTVDGLMTSPNELEVVGDFRSPDILRRGDEEALRDVVVVVVVVAASAVR